MVLTNKVLQKTQVHSTGETIEQWKSLCIKCPVMENEDSAILGVNIGRNKKLKREDLFCLHWQLYLPTRHSGTHLNPTIQRAKAGGHELEATLGYKTRPCFKKASSLQKINYISNMGSPLRSPWLMLLTHENFKSLIVSLNTRKRKLKWMKGWVKDIPKTY